jgi:uncharacterized membrane protein YbhN (UPF0104 family)
VDGLLSALESAGAQFERLDARLVALALVLHVANHVLRSLAWRNVLAAAYPEQRIPLIGITAAYAVGVALNAVVPGRGGDAAKVALARARIERSSITTIASTMAVVTLFDLVAASVLVLCICATGALPFAPRLPLQAATRGPVVALAAATAVIAAALLAQRARAPLARVRAKARQGGAILATPGAYLRRVAAVQACAWGCRIAVVMLLLHAFGLQASVPVAALVMVLCGASTLVPLTPGGAGTQQVMLAYALGQAASAAVVLSFSVGMQAGVTVVNATLGLGAAMVAFRSLRPITAVRSALGVARAGA